MADILVFCEVSDGKVRGTARELLGKAKELADGGDVTALIMGSDLGDAADGLGALGADAVMKVEHAALEHYVPGAWAAAFSQAVEDKNPDVVLGAATGIGKDLLPRAAALLETGVAVDVVDLFEGDDGIAGKRSLYSGKAMATVNVTSDPKFFSVRPNSFVIDSVEAGDGDVEDFEPDLDEDWGYTVTDIETSGGGTIELTEAKRIIAGGRSVKSKENFALFAEPARLLGAAIGASRAAVDAGYAGHSTQVGQTGKVVNPQLYIACGISGAIQHLAGMRTSKVIVSINKDPEAPIFQHSTYGIVGDLFEVVPLLTEELKKVLHD
jgi:electron transfer flavoprotein alpha subunit